MLDQLYGVFPASAAQIIGIYADFADTLARRTNYNAYFLQVRPL